MHVSSLLRMEWFKNNYLSNLRNSKIKILDIGSYDVNGSYRELFKEEKWEYFGLDIQEGPNVDIVVQDIYNWANIQSETFDVVISGQAFEHIEFFWLTMSEIQRVLKVNGLCCIIAPSSGPEHRYPVDCYRFNEDGMKALANYVGFQILHVSSSKEKDDLNFKDDECEWKDSMLIAKKTDNNAGYKNSEHRRIANPFRIVFGLFKENNADRR